MDSTVISDNEQVFIHTYFGFVAIVVLVYDHILTFSDEVFYIWKRPKNWSSYFFFLNRYSALFANIAIAILSMISLSVEVLIKLVLPSNTPDPDGHSCKQYTFFRQLMLVVNQVIVCILLVIRTYALYGRDLRILIFMVASGLALAAGACWSLIGQHSYVATDVSGCHDGYSNSTAVHLAVAWEVLFVYDSLLFLLTVLKTYKARHRHEFLPQDGSVDIITLIFRDGAIYFAVMAVANLSNIITFYVAPSLLKGGLSTVASCISVTMMSRLMLNLHKSNRVGILSEGPTGGNALGTMVFTSRVASTGFRSSRIERTGFSASTDEPVEMQRYSPSISPEAQS